MKTGTRPSTRSPKTVAPSYDLRLYVTGMTQRSIEAMSNIRQICEEHLPGRHTLEIVDMYENAARASEDQIVASPTLIKMAPAPVRRFVGNLSDRKRVLIGLELPFEETMDDAQIKTSDSD